MSPAKNGGAVLAVNPRVSKAIHLAAGASMRRPWMKLNHTRKDPARKFDRKFRDNRLRCWRFQEGGRFGLPCQRKLRHRLANHSRKMAFSAEKIQPPVTEWPRRADVPPRTILATNLVTCGKSSGVRWRCKIFFIFFRSFFWLTHKLLINNDLAVDLRKYSVNTV